MSTARTTRRTSQRMTLAVLLAASPLVVAACSSSASGGAGEQTPFVFPIPDNPATLNPVLSTDPAVGAVTAAVYEPLTHVGGTYEVTPGLAESWEVSEDGMEYTFHLQQDATWHDGEPFTAEDVEFNFEEVMGLHPFGARIADNVEDVEVVDEHTAKVRLSAPYGPMLEALSGQKLLPMHIFAGQELSTSEHNMKPVGTGPFKFESFTTGESVVMTKHEGYWRETGDVERLIFQIMPDQNSRALALQSGEVDGMFTPFLNTAATVQNMQNPKLVWENDRSAMPTVTNLWFNTESEKLADAEVRKALYTAIDRSAIAEKALSGLATEPLSMIPAKIEWAQDPSVDYRQIFAFDPEAAGQALDAAGYPADADGVRFDLRLDVISSSPAAIATAEMVKSSLEAIGVSVDLSVLDRQIYTDKVQAKGDFDLTIFEMSAFQDPSLGISRMYFCNPERVPMTNPSGFCDKELDAALTAAAEATGRESRAVHFAEAQELAAQSLFSAPLAELSPRTFVRNDEWGGLDGFLSVNSRDWAHITSAG